VPPQGEVCSKQPGPGVSRRGIGHRRIGLIWVLASGLPHLGRLPGDIVIERPNSRIYFPIVTCIVISVVLTLLTWLIRSVMR
jgi:hypothetical protein